MATKCKTRQYLYRNRVTHVGRVEVWDDKHHLWSASTGIHRLCKADAENDARNLANEINERNKR